MAEINYEVLLSSLPYPVFVLDMEQSIQYANPCSFEMLAPGHGQFLSAVENAAPVFGGDAIRKALTKVMQEDCTVRIDEVETVNGFGKKLNFDISISRLQPGQILIAMLPLPLDRAKQDLPAAEENGIDIIYRGLLHELNNPLGGIRGSAQLLQQGAVKADEQRTFLDGIVADVDRIQNILNAFGRTAFGSELEEVTLSLPRLIQKITGNVEAGAARKVTWVMRVDLGLPDLIMDGGKVEQILTNLLLNAAVFTGDDGVIRVSAGSYRRFLREVGQKHLWIRITVEDTGPGVIGLEKKLFTPFYTTRSGGSGLGLALSRRFAHQMGGDLTVRSSELGGASFQLMIPVRYKK